MGFIVLLTLIAGLVRFYKIDNPSEIVFDEVHFGGFASKYITSRFFFDVHPPRTSSAPSPLLCNQLNEFMLTLSLALFSFYVVGKLMIAFSGVFAGYNGTSRS